MATTLGNTQRYVLIFGNADIVNRYVVEIDTSNGDNSLIIEHCEVPRKDGFATLSSLAPSGEKQISTTDIAKITS